MQLPAPNRAYWAGACRFGPYLLAPIVLLNAISWMLSISMLAYGSNTAMNSFHTLVDPNDGGEYAWRMFALWAELIHLPIHILLCLELFRGWRLHPAAALSFSLVMMGVWFNFAFWGYAIDWWWIEWYAPKAWENLSYARFAVSLATTAVYVAYVVFAAAAVHRWRNTRTARDAASASAQKSSLSSSRVNEVTPEAEKR